MLTSLLIPGRIEFYSDLDRGASVSLPIGLSETFNLYNVNSLAHSNRDRITPLMSTHNAAAPGTLGSLYCIAF